MENTIPTEDEFLKSRGLGGYQQFEGVLIEFAKMHVEAALKAASENAQTTHLGNNLVVIDANTILTAYPLSNIK